MQLITEVVPAGDVIPELTSAMTVQGIDIFVYWDTCHKSIRSTSYSTAYNIVLDVHALIKDLFLV